MSKNATIYVLIVTFVFFSFIGCGLYLMEIEDHYGDLQEIYFESKSGDLIINKKTKSLGIISKNWKRANIITKQKDTLDLYDFLHENKYEVLRGEQYFDLNDLTFEKIVDLKNKNAIKSILIK